MTDDLIQRRRWSILAVLVISVFLVVVDNTIVNVALPTLSRELDADTSQLQWIVDSYSLVFAGLLLAFGSLGDRFGRKGAIQLVAISTPIPGGHGHKILEPKLKAAASELDLASIQALLD